MRTAVESSPRGGSAHPDAQAGREHVLGVQAEVRSFLWSKAASVAGLLPVGVWTALHLWDNVAAVQGAEAWERAVTAHRGPVPHAVTLAVVLVPLLLHAGWGVARLRSTRVPSRYRGFPSLRHVLHRLSAVGLLLFLGAHLWLALIRPRLLDGRPEPFADIAHEMRFHAPTLAVYVLGVLGTAYHLANGLQAIGIAWGLHSRRGTMSRLSVLSGAAFAVLLALGWGAIWALWRAGGP